MIADKRLNKIRKLVNIIYTARSVIEITVAANELVKLSKEIRHEKRIRLYSGG